MISCWKRTLMEKVSNTSFQFLCSISKWPTFIMGFYTTLPFIYNVQVQMMIKGNHYVIISVNYLKSLSPPRCIHYFKIMGASHSSICSWVYPPCRWLPLAQLFLCLVTYHRLNSKWVVHGVLKFTLSQTRFNGLTDHHNTSVL